MRTRRPSLLPAALGIALVVFGGTVAVMVRSGPLDPRLALAGLAAAAALTVALVVMIWARHRTESALPPAREIGPSLVSPGRSGTIVVPLGDGEAAIIFDEPVPSRPAAPTPAAVRREATHTADAIWDAVDAAVSEAGPPPPGA